MPPLLRMRGISKAFGPTQALRDVELEVNSGQVLALIGENGAGKSTLMKVLSGVYTPDTGEMLLSGKPYRPTGPSHARRSGVSMVYQELTLAEDLSIEDNIMLGREDSTSGLLNRRQQHSRVRQALALLGHQDLRPETIVSRLSVGAQQLVEIARGLVHDAKIMVFDEPTSSLGRRDVAHLFEVIQKLQSQGMGIVYISHFLEEVRDICNNYAVLRDGNPAGSGELNEVTDREIVQMMVGRDVDELFPQVPHELGEPILQVHQLSGELIPHDSSITIHRGEIVGLAGLVGAGRTELARCIYGLNTVRSGEVTVLSNREHSFRRTGVAKRILHGLGLVSENRKEEGLAQTLSVEDNLTLSYLQPFATCGLLKLRRRRDSAKDWIKRMEIKTAGPAQSVQELSGGNQQKVAIARVLHQNADVLLLDEPTRGIDVGTKALIYRLVGELAAQGKGILFVSSYLPELMAVCDRIAVMARGRIRDVKPRNEWTEEELLEVAISADTT
jgi:ribose transport system ATP-binding protein